MNEMSKRQNYNKWHYIKLMGKTLENELSKMYVGVAMFGMRERERVKRIQFNKFDSDQIEKLLTNLLLLVVY